MEVFKGTSVRAAEVYYSHKHVTDTLIMMHFKGLDYWNNLFHLGFYFGMFGHNLGTLYC